MTAALAVNQLLLGYHLSAPQPLSYYSAAVCGAARPACCELAWHCLRPETPPFLRSSSVQRASAAGVWEFLLPLSIPLLLDESFNSPVLSLLPSLPSPRVSRTGSPACSHLFC